MENKNIQELTDAELDTNYYLYKNMINGIYGNIKNPPPIDDKIIEKYNIYRNEKIRRQNEQRN